MPLPLETTRQQYRELFLSANRLIEDKLNALIAESGASCPTCHRVAATLELDNPLQAPLHPDCPWEGARYEAIQFLEVEIGQQIIDAIETINKEKQRYTCKQTGACCRLASSEFNWEQLLQKASQGDSFAQQFTSVFLPYPSNEAAAERFPDVVAEVLAYASKQKPGEQDVTFYHCPYIQEDNKCSLYGTAKRPAICADYPGTPLTFVHKHCAWRPWQENSHRQSLIAHASIELASHWANQLRQALGVATASPSLE